MAYPCYWFLRTKYLQTFKEKCTQSCAIGDCLGRDLNLPPLGHFGHIGLANNINYVYEMLTESTVASESNLESQLWYNTIYSFMNKTEYWGNRWIGELWTPEQEWRFNTLAGNMDFCERVGCNYNYFTLIQDPSIQFNGTNKIYNKGIYRCDTFVIRMYNYIGVTFNISTITPASVYSAFPDYYTDSFINYQLNQDSSTINGKLENNRLGLNSDIDEISKILSNDDFQNNYKNAISLINKETNPLIIREIALYLIIAARSGKVNDIELIKSEIRSLFNIPNCADELAKIDIGSIYSEKELENIFYEYNQNFSNRGKMDLVNIFLSKSILNEKNYDVSSPIGQFISSNIPQKNIQLTKTHLAAGWFRLTSDFTFSDNFKKELRKIIADNKNNYALQTKDAADFKVLNELLNDPDNNKKHKKGNFKITLTTLPPIK